MFRVLNCVKRVAFFLAGLAVAAITLPWRERGGMDPATTDKWKRSLAGLETRPQTREAADAARFTRVEIRLEEQIAKPAVVPSTGQIFAVMEPLLSKTMTSLDDRLNHWRTPSLRKTTISRTDSLLTCSRM
jgi:hypothetical protein